MLQWIIDEETKSASFNESNVRNIARMILVVNFAAIHTSANVRRFSPLEL